MSRREALIFRERLSCVELILRGDGATWLDEPSLFILLENIMAALKGAFDLKNMQLVIICSGRIVAYGMLVHHCIDKYFVVFTGKHHRRVGKLHRLRTNAIFGFFFILWSRVLNFCEAVKASGIIRKLLLCLGEWMRLFF